MLCYDIKKEIIREILIYKKPIDMIIMITIIRIIR